MFLSGSWQFPQIPQPAPLPEDVRKIAFLLLLALHGVLIAADIYIAWTEGLLKT